MTKQWLQQKIADMEARRDDPWLGLDEDDSNNLEALRIALASLEAEAVAQVLSSRAGNDTSTIDKALPEGTSLFTSQPAPVAAPDEIYAELYQLREEVKGPDGFNTWRDAATAEKVLRLSMERDALRYRFLRDKDAFGDENEPGLASWDDMAEMEYNEFDAAVDARMNDADMPRYSFTQGKMVENDVAASEKKAPNERYKQISDIDYLGAMSAFHSDEWHKMGPITAYMHGFNARRAAMLQGAEPVTTAYKLRDAVETIRNSGIEINAEKIFAERDALNAPDCWCRTCRPITLTDMRFVVCPDCGNKRCPHANDHRNACTGSNEPGQEGSAYPAAPKQEVKP
jgi:hypothetical protein